MTAPTQAPPSTGGEYVVVRLNEDDRLRIAEIVLQKFRICAPGVADGLRLHSANAAADRIVAFLVAPTGYVPVKRELLEWAARVVAVRGMSFKIDNPEHADNLAKLAEQLRACLAAPSSGTDNKE